MKKLLTILSILLALTFLSCQNQTIYPTDYSQINTWGELFEAYWQKMSTNYLFWSIDDTGDSSWQSIYDEYLPKFTALGDIDINNADTLDAAYRYFFDVTKNLSDGHYFTFLTPDKSAINDRTKYRRGYSPSQYRILTTFKDKDGNTVYNFDNDDAAYKVLISGDYEDGSEYDNLQIAYENHAAETTRNIARYTFNVPNIDWSTTPTKVNIATIDNLEYYEDQTGLSVILGTLPSSMAGDKTIVYFAFNGFSFIPSAADYPYHTALINVFQDLVTEKDGEIDGIIIDARGNVGGRADNLNWLWKVFTNGEDIQIANTRRKGGDERQNYSAYMPFYIENCGYTGTFDKSIPIAYITNDGSVSCAEVSALFFKALKDYHGYKTAIIGERSLGGQGMLVNANSGYYDLSYSETLYSAGCTDIAPYIRLIYTPYLQTEYLNGENYEGKGVPIDGDPVYFDYSAFTTGTDAKLNAAITWVNDNLGGN